MTSHADQQPATRGRRLLSRVGGPLAAVLATGLTVVACGAVGSPERTSGSAYAGLLDPLPSPDAIVERPTRSPLEVPARLRADSWEELWTIGEDPAPPPPTLAASAPFPGVEPLPAFPTSIRGYQPSPDGAVSLPTGVGDDAREPAAAPVRVTVPRLGIDSALDPLGLRRDGGLQAPPQWDVAGWYTGGPRPGDRGPAVIAGHLDSPSGGAAFGALPEVIPGDRVVVTDREGVTHDFEVTRIARTPKRGFPTQEVYGAVPGAELRLITCTGLYLPAAGGYQDNLLVFARLVTT